MIHQAFLIALAQMASRKKADITVEGTIFSIQPLSKKNRWLLSSCVFSGDQGDIPPGIQQCVSDAQLLKKQYGGAYLQYDSYLECVYLMQEVEMPLGSYLGFRKNTKEFICSTNEWKAILESLADRDYTFI